MNRAEAIAGFQQHFRRDPAWIARAPGRVNLIGEHTDYNDGFVMPVAIEFATWTVLAPRSDRCLVVFAANKDEALTIDLDDPGAPCQRHWSDYVRGMAVELERDGVHLKGADLWFGGDVPFGAGVSSSAALEVSLGLALLSLSGVVPDRIQVARAGQRAEHHYAGTQCGIMDQFISAHARAGHALMLDCRSLTFRLIPLPESVRLVICDTGVKHELAGGEYNQRRAQCEEGVARLKAHLPAIRALRDVSIPEFRRFEGILPDVIRRRCRHVIEENARVEEFATALNDHDLPVAGRLMAASHRSLRDDYEVSCRELDVMVELAGQAQGCLGARMTGGGFGGCTVNLVDAGNADLFRKTVARGYERAAGRAPRLFTSSAGDGASISPVA